MKGRSSGLTLVEAAFATAILVVGLVGLLAVLPVAARATTDSVQHGIAADHLASAADLILGTPYANLAARFPDGGTLGAEDMSRIAPNALPGERITIRYKKWDAAGNELALGTATVPPTPTALPPAGTLDRCEIQLTVAWNRDGPRPPAVLAPLYTVTIVRTQ